MVFAEPFTWRPQADLLSFAGLKPGKTEMRKGSSGKNSEESNGKKVSTKKLDFLLDSIETEVADLAEVVEVEGPILDDETTNQETEAIGLNDPSIAMDSLELDVDLFDEPAEPQVETNSVDNQAHAALDAMSEAEGEIEAMMATTGSDSENIEATTGEDTANDEMDHDLAQALDELLATSELDVSKLIEATKEQRVEKEREELDDLELDLEVEKEDGVVTKEDAIEAELAEDLLDTNEFQRPGENKEESGSEMTTAPASSDEQLADLLSHKIETLVNRMVEERLAEIADRVIKDRINKIFSSMK